MLDVPNHYDLPHQADPSCAVRLSALAQEVATCTRYYKNIPFIVSYHPAYLLR